jgi:hypothetical protein
VLQREFDLAIEILRHSVHLSPTDIRCREALRDAERHKYFNSRGVGILLKTARARARLKVARSNRNWKEVEQSAEECLYHNPFDVEANVELGNAFRERGLQELAIFAYQCAYDAMPSRSDLREAIEELKHKREEGT